MPLVLVHNDVVANPAHQWDDVEGVQYHYPSKYRAKVQTGEPFVYYRGIHRAGGKRGPAEYTGSGRIGKIWADPARKGAWYCAVVGFERFATPVLAKVDGLNREDIPTNLWRDGVRSLDPAVYAAIMKEGEAAPASAAPVRNVIQITPSDNLILPPDLAGHQPVKSDYRHSRRAKAIGDWAEQAAFDYIQAHIVDCTDCVHRAALGEKPGWDLDYRDTSGVLQRVEVKGTTAAAFTGIELTVNEMRAAEKHGEGYWLCLVSRCETANPKIQMVRNPAAKLAAGEWSAKPMLFTVRFTAASGGVD